VHQSYQTVKIESLKQQTVNHAMEAKIKSMKMANDNDLLLFKINGKLFEKRRHFRCDGDDLKF
jgi:hypothetical protein